MWYSITAVFVLSITILYLKLQNNASYNEHRVIVSDVIDDVYDYVIAGGGTAGSVIAARLAEDHNNKVLLLEAGGFYDESWKFHVLPLWAELQGSKYDWEYYTEPQKYSHFGLEENRSYWPRGRVLGGSGMINVAQYTRGSRYDFDEWAANGCEGWGYKDILPYFLKAEDIHIDELKSSKYHNVGGTMAVSGSSVTQLSDLFLKAGQELGYDITDYNGKDQLGFAKAQLSTRNGMRESSAVAYLGRPGKKENLDIAINSFVTKVKLNDNVATGVYYIRNNRKYFVRAKKEVILSAGTVKSPQILMLSGIGPKKHLEDMDIPVVADLPVGENLQDHIFFGLHSKINKSIGLTQESFKSFSSLINYQLFGTGPLTSSGVEATAFMKIGEKKKENLYPDLQIALFSVILNYNGLKLNNKVRDNYERFVEDVDGFTFSIINTHPKSRGHIRLRTNDPFDYPVIDPQYLQEQTDIDDLIAGIRIWEKYIETPTMKKLGASVNDMKKSFCSQHEFRSDAYWECVIRHMALTCYHISCTCKMGAVDDPTAVLDPFLRVKGIKGLRVVDLSAFPNVTVGNTNGPTVMLAEKAADMIRGIDSVKQFRENLPVDV